MTLFIIIALLILLATLFLLTRPLLKTRNTLSYERQAQNIHYAKERLQELEDQLKNASISATDYEALKLEIESNLASDINLADQTQTSQKVTPRRSNKLIISLLSALLPLTVLGLYGVTGTPSALAPQADTAQRPSVEDVDLMLANIEQRLAANPSDAQGWAVLSRAYLSLGRFREAHNGFLKLIELEGESAELLTSLADASGLMAEGDMSGQPTQYIERALKLEPDNPQALWLAGLSAAQQNQAEKARGYWNKLLPLLGNTPKKQEELKVIIQQTFEGQPALGSEAVPGSSETASVPTDSSENSGSGLNVAVSIDPAILERVSASDLVFIFARAETGPPAPLAVKRLTVADLPVTITLTDADAMMPQLKMSLFDDLLVSARIAKSGNPVAQAGDIQSAQVKTANNSVEEITLVINTIID